MIQNAQKISPHELARQIARQVTHGIDDPDKFYKNWLYARFVLMGAFLHVNNQSFARGMTLTKLRYMELEYTTLVNHLLKIKYGPDAFLPSNFKFIRSLWQRSLYDSEKKFVAKLINAIPDVDEYTMNHAKLIVLGSIECTRRTYYDMAGGTDLEMERYIKYANKYIHEITKISDFFSKDDISIIVKI